MLIAGIILLIKGANWLINGATSLGEKLKISGFLIGMTIVAFGTSLPELVVSLMASAKDSGGIILGNIIGSNISNLLLILGLVSLFFPIKLSKPAVNKDLFFSILATFFLFFIAIFVGFIDRSIGLIFLLLFFMFFYYRFKYSAKQSFSFGRIANHQVTLKNIFLIILGSVSLFIGAKLTVSGAITISQSLNLSQFLISATVIAIGTSLPELITSIQALRKNKGKMAVGNIIGSNIFNILWVLGFVSLSKPIELPITFNLDIIFLLFVSIIFFVSMFVGEKYRISRKKAISFLLLYLAYIVFIVVRG